MLGVGGEITRINATSRNGGEYHADTDLLIEKPAWLPYPIGVKPEGNKMQRLEAQTAKIEAGHVRIPQEAHWLGAFLHEVLAFPNGCHDDQVTRCRSSWNGAVDSSARRTGLCARAIYGSIPPPLDLTPRAGPAKRGVAAYAKAMVRPRRGTGLATIGPSPTKR